MYESASPSPHARTLLLGALATLGLTSAHHSYGAFRYDTRWRLHGALAAAAIGAGLLVPYSAYRKRPGTRSGRIAGWVLAGVVLAIPVVATGAFEGLYNHVVKNALYLARAPAGLLARLFPPPTYEAPNDALFEISGVAQVIPAAVAGRAALRFARDLRGAA